MKTPLLTEGQTIEDTHKIPYFMLPMAGNYPYNYVDVAKFWMKSGSPIEYRSIPSWIIVL